jgi:hypothetical protein
MGDIMFKITREKHLDHMVKVVPFIVGCYAIQCYVILHVGPSELAKISLSILGGFLALMIGGFVTYDLRHEVEVFDDHLKISFLQSTETIYFSEITSMTVNEPGQSFATLTLKTKKMLIVYASLMMLKKSKAGLKKNATTNRWPLNQKGTGIVILKVVGP